MPLYEYLCPLCGRRSEELRDMDERLSSPCTECSGTSLIVPSMSEIIEEETNGSKEKSFEAEII